ncbi:MAG TPA: potassium channel family protein, partial [Microthrixaceae bacterium]|nr:potassium channel family protein [Microthrixaceae bacterium]
DKQQRRRAVALMVIRILVVWIGLVSAYFLIPFDRRPDDNFAVRTACSILIMLVVLGWEVWSTSKANLPQLRAISALGAIFPLALLVFAGIYLSMSSSLPRSFNENLNHISALYFSVTTFATVGFGDIAAKSDGARLLVTVQTLLNLLLLGSIIRLLGFAVRANLDSSGHAPGSGRIPPQI